MLGSNGGAGRIAEYATSKGVDVDADAVHATKSQIFQDLLQTSGVEARPGVADTISNAKADGIKIGFVTTTSRENIDALLTALAPAVTADSFDVIVDASTVATGKPDPAAYLHALDALGEKAGDCVAVEDNAGGARAAAAADVTCVAFPNENTVDADFGPVAETVSALDPTAVRALLAA
jgi:HAD superfamily hydrolase (TIGR01509 family)